MSDTAHSGASAKRGDIVRNLTTGAVGNVTGAKQDGRLIVATTHEARERAKREARAYGEAWERYNVEVLAEFQGVTKR